MQRKSPHPTTGLMPNQSPNNSYFGETHPSFIAEHELQAMESAVPAVPSPSPLLPPSALSLQGPSEKRRWPCKHCSAIAKTLVCYHQHCFGYKSHSSTRVAMKKVNSSPARPKALQDHVLILDKSGLAQAALC